MDSLPAIFAGSFLVALSGALMPGPMLTLTVAEAAKGGWLSGPLLTLGHGVLELMLLLLVVLGLGGFLSSPVSLKALGLVGGTALAFMGFLTLKGAGKGRATSRGGPSGTPRGRARWVVSGAVVSLSNPYWVLWWATVGLGYLALAGRMGAAGIGSFFGGHILADLAWYTLVSALAASGRRAIGGRAYAAVTAFCGAFLVFFGGYFVYKGLTI